MAANRTAPEEFVEEVATRRLQALDKLASQIFSECTEKSFAKRFLLSIRADECAEQENRLSK